jgi:hypothetical protein
MGSAREQRQPNEDTVNNSFLSKSTEKKELKTEYKWSCSPGLHIVTMLQWASGRNPEYQQRNDKLVKFAFNNVKHFENKNDADSESILLFFGGCEILGCTR